MSADQNISQTCLLTATKPPQTIVQALRNQNTHTFFAHIQ